MHAWRPQRPEESIGSPEIKLQRAVGFQDERSSKPAPQPEEGHCIGVTIAFSFEVMAFNLNCESSSKPLGMTSVVCC